MATETLVVPAVVARRLREEAERHCMTLEEYLVELVLNGADPPERAREYAEAAGALLEEARRGLREGDWRQAAEKLWGAAALAVKAYAAWREGRRLTSHGELWEWKRRLEKELGRWVHDAWMNATGMHVCFYEEWCGAEDVEEALERIERLVEAVRRAIGG